MKFVGDAAARYSRPLTRRIVMFPMNRVSIVTSVEYTRSGRRVVKTFPNATAARKFYLYKSVAGANPKVVGNRGVTTMTENNNSIETGTEILEIGDLAVAPSESAITIDGDNPNGEYDLVTGEPIVFANTSTNKTPVKETTMVTVNTTPAKPSKAPKGSGQKPAKAPVEPTKGDGEYGMARSKDVRWNEKKVAVFKALKALKATSSGGAVSAKDVADKAGLTERDVRHYCYHAAAANLVAVVEVEWVRGYGFHLTAKGAGLDPAKELKNQETK